MYIFLSREIVSQRNNLAISLPRLTRTVFVLFIKITFSELKYYVMLCTKTKTSNLWEKIFQETRYGEVGFLFRVERQGETI